MKKMTSMMTYNGPNYSKVEAAAYRTLTECGLDSLPVKFKKIIKHYDDLRIQKYSHWAKKRGITIEEACQILNSKFGVLWVHDNESLVLYNDTDDNPQRVRFTIAHEIGHYILGHNKATDKTIITRYALDDQQYDIFEKEANHFASKLLAPLPLLYKINGNWKDLDRMHIRDFFDVSYTAAGYIKDAYDRRLNGNYIDDNHDITEAFSDYITQETTKKRCKHCLHDSYGNEIEFCEICGEVDFIELDADTYFFFKNFNAGGKNVKYKKVEVDESGRALICPLCDNEEIEDHEDICMICGKYIRNICSGVFVEYDYYTDQVSPDNLDGCQTVLKGNARHCTKCGAMSTFFYYDLLKPWTEEHPDVKEELPY